MVIPFPSNYLLALDWPERFFFSKIIAEYWPSLNQIIIEALGFICSLSLFFLVILILYRE